MTIGTGGELVDADNKFFLNSQKFAMGTGASTLTTVGTSQGTVIDVDGDFLSYGDANNYIQRVGASLDIKATSGTLDFTQVYIDSANKRVAVGSDGSAVTVANTTAGTVMEDTGFKSYLNATNYIRRDGTSLDIKATSFSLTAGDLAIDSYDPSIKLFDNSQQVVGVTTRTTYPSARSSGTGFNTGVTFTGTTTTACVTPASEGEVVKFKFDYDSQASGTFNCDFDVEVEGQRIDNDTWESLSGWGDFGGAIKAQFNIVTQTAGTVSVTNTSNSSVVQLSVTGSGSNNYEGEITFYFYIAVNYEYDNFRLKFTDNSTSTQTQANLITGTTYLPVTEMNKRGFWIRETDTIITRVAGGEVMSIQLPA